MKLISVQSRGNRLAIVEESEFAIECFQTIGKTFNKRHFVPYFYHQTTTKKLALKAADEWLQEAKE
ncbi:hypothetical protein EOM81_12395 [bacterium]|nr:hypothetical protein [bacterium]